MLDDSSNSIPMKLFPVWPPSACCTLPVENVGKETQTETETVTFKWTITHFLDLYSEDGMPGAPKVSLLYSKKFTAFQFNEFSIRLLPKYEADTGESFVSISLFLESQTTETAPLTIDYQISLLDQFDQKCRTESMSIYSI